MQIQHMIKRIGGVSVAAQDQKKDPRWNKSPKFLPEIGFHRSIFVPISLGHSGTSKRRKTTVFPALKSMILDCLHQHHHHDVVARYYTTRAVFTSQDKKRGPPAKSPPE